MKTHYCLECGTMMEIRNLEGRQRQVCPDCGWIFYEHRKVSAGVCIEKDGQLLLVQRSIEPWFQKWCMPAGYIEVDEEPEKAAVREAFEETGLVVKIRDLAGIYTYSDDPRGNGLVLIYNAEIVGGNLKLTSETMQAGFFSASEIEKMHFAGSSADRQVKDWLILNSHAKGI